MCVCVCVCARARVRVCTVSRVIQSTSIWRKASRTCQKKTFMSVHYEKKLFEFYPTTPC